MKINIAILEDNLYFNKLITRQLNLYLKNLARTGDLNFEVQSYLHSSEFRNNLQPNLDIAFVDFYLNQGVTGIQILKDIRYVNKDCKVVIISSTRNHSTVIQPMSVGAYSFIYKDDNFIPSCCFYIENELNRRLNGDDFM